MAVSESRFMSSAVPYFLDKGNVCVSHFVPQGCCL